MAKPKSAKGHVLFVKPGKMRWDYDDPKGNLVVSDGTTLWSYDAAGNSATKMTDAKKAQASIVVSFLMGTGSLAADFDLKFAKLTAPGFYVLEARPKTPTTSCSFALFYVDAATYQVARALVVDAAGEKNRFDLSHLALNGAYVAPRFQWTPPAGALVKVIP